MRQAHDRRCYLLGITDPAVVKKLWDEDEAKRKAAEPAGEKKRGRRRAAE